MVKWKGIDLSTYGIVVEKTPTISKGKKDIETYSVAGRNGFLSIDKGTYQPFSLQIECHAKETANFDDIKAFLDGYGTLSFDNEKEYTAIVNNAIPFEKVQMFKSFAIQFMVNPIAHDITPTTLTITDDFTITGATARINPTLTLVASAGGADVLINGVEFTTSNEDATTYILDCENKVITKNGVNAASEMSGDFPYFKNGENTYESTGVTSLSASYKKAYL
ncbi:MAG: hypothetical protein II625_09680 [Bacilli bacterium]|nr:hypothetical protein [Bacilli bacterium]